MVSIQRCSESWLQARSQDFSWEGAYVKNRDQMILMIRYASSEDTWGGGGGSVQPMDL